MIRFFEKLGIFGSLLFLLIIGMACVLIIFGVYSTPITWNYILVGLMILLPLFFLLKESISTTHTKNNALYEQLIRKFKATADRILVVLDEAQILEKKQYETITNVTGKAAALNEISGYGHHNEEQIEHVYCVVTFQLPYHGKTIEATHIIPKDKTHVRMYFYMQKTTTLYINPYDTSEYYLDMEFLSDY